MSRPDQFVWSIDYTGFALRTLLFVRDKAFALRLARSCRRNGWRTEVKRVTYRTAVAMHDERNFIFGTWPFEIRKVTPLAKGRSYERLRARILAERHDRIS